MTEKFDSFPVSDTDSLDPDEQARQLQVSSEDPH